MNALEIHLNVVDVEIKQLDAEVIHVESRISVLSEETLAPVELSDFDARIARFNEELNTPTYVANEATTYHPGVYNVPHDTVQDTPIKFEPEYAE